MAQRTTDYKQFKNVLGNRSVNIAHAEKLAVSIAKDPTFLEHRPILVNENMEVIDGQHRLWAAKKLNIPVFFEVREGLTIKDAITLNLNQRNWTLDDYVSSFADQGLEAYKRLQDYIKEYPKLPTSVILGLVYGKRDKSRGSSVKRGELTLISDDEAREILDAVSEIAALLPARMNESTARTLKTLMGSDAYDHDRMLYKLSQYGESMYRPFRHHQDIARNFEEIYNFNSRSSQAARLF